MAEIITGGGKRTRLQPPRIDLTPMVDLGFLLITFFMFTTTLAESKALVLNMPVPLNEKPNEIPYESTVTLIPIKEQRILYYNGTLTDQTIIETTDYTTDGIRSILMEKIRTVTALPASYSAEAHKLHVLIKPHPTCPYNDLVALLDEMLINNVPYYVIVDITETEQDIITNKLQLRL